MRRELGIARSGLACCLCSENSACSGCGSGTRPDEGSCFNLRCSPEKGLGHCFECQELCHEGLLAKIKPRGFSGFARRFGVDHLPGEEEELKVQPLYTPLPGGDNEVRDRWSD